MSYDKSSCSRSICRWHISVQAKGEEEGKDEPTAKRAKKEDSKEDAKPNSATAAKPAERVAAGDEADKVTCTGNKKLIFGKFACKCAAFFMMSDMCSCHARNRSS